MSSAAPRQFPEIDALIAEARLALREDLDRAARLSRDLEDRSRAVGYTHGLGMARLFQEMMTVMTGRSDDPAGLQSVLEESRARNDRWLEGETLAALGVAAIQRGDYAASFEYKLRAIAVTRETGDTATLVRTLNNIGNDYGHIGDMDASHQCFVEALDISLQTGNRFGQAQSLNNLASTYRHIKDYENALRHTREALALALECGHKVLEADIRRLLANTCLGIGQTEEAEEHYRASYEIANKLGNAMIATKALLGVADVHRERGDLAQALELCQQTRDEALQKRFPRGEMRALWYAGGIYVRMGRYDQARECLDRAAELLETIPVSEEAVGIHQTYTELGEAQGNFALAFSSYRKLNEVKEKVQGQTEHRRIAAITSKFQVEQVEREAEMERRKNQELLQAQEELQRAYAEKTALLERLQEQQQELERLAVQASLPGLYNRRHFEQCLHDRYGAARAGNTPLTVALADVDDFKKINDGYGHPTGDAVLQRVAAVLRDWLPDGGVVARYGGEEFALLLPTADARLRLSALVGQIASTPWSEMAPNLRVTVSIGYCDDLTLPGAERMIQQADDALYRAKANGKNQSLGPLHRAA